MKDVTIIYKGLLTDTLVPTIEYLYSKYSCNIIFSTWDTIVTSSIPEYVKLVISKDPGPGPIQNLERQTTQVYNALLKTTTEKVFLLRSEVVAKTIPLEKYDKDIVYFSSIMSCLFGYPNPEIVNFKLNWFNHDYFCRVGDWFHLGSKENLLKLYKPYSMTNNFSDIGSRFNNKACTEQYIFCRYYDGEKKLKTYHKFLSNKVGILDLVDIKGDITSGPYTSKTDAEYYNASRHKELKELAI